MEIFIYCIIFALILNGIAGIILKKSLSLSRFKQFNFYDHPFMGRLETGKDAVINGVISLIAAGLFILIFFVR